MRARVTQMYPRVTCITKCYAPTIETEKNLAQKKEKKEDEEREREKARLYRLGVRLNCEFGGIVSKTNKSHGI